MALITAGELQSLTEFENQLLTIKAECDFKLGLIRAVKEGQSIDVDGEWRLFSCRNEVAIKNLVIAKLKQQQGGASASGSLNPLERAKIFLQKHRTNEICHAIDNVPEINCDLSNVT